MRALRVFSGIAGPVLILVSVLGVLFSILALIDPAGVQASDDANPLGAPPTFLQSSGILLAYLLLGAVGTYLLWIFLSAAPVSVNPAMPFRQAQGREPGEGSQPPDQT